MNSTDQDQPKLDFTPILIGEWTFYPDLYQLFRDNEVVRLEPRTAQLLHFLAQSPGKPLSRENLIELAWPGMIVGDEALTSAINKLRKALGDDSQEPKYIETIPKKGYRLIAKTTVSNDKKDRKTDNQPVININHLSKTLWITISLLILLLVLAPFFLSKLYEDNKEKDVPNLVEYKQDIPVIAVLPFDNLSQDETQEYFADGITEDIITDLTRFGGIRVLARNTTFRFRGQKVNYQQLVDNLNISHVVEGSVRKSGDQLRISARLIYAANGQNIWAERYDKTLKDVFSVQDDVTRNIVNALSVHLNDKDKQVFERPTTSNFEAYDLYLKGRQKLSERTSESDQMAMEFYQAAIKLDPSFARAYGAIAVLLIRSANSGYTENPKDIKDKALFYAQKAVGLDDQSQNTLWALSFTRLYRKEINEAETAVSQALNIAPNYADGLALLALIKNYLGEGQEAINLINRAKELNPGYSWDYLFNLGVGYYNLENYEKAIEQLSQALERNDNARPPRLFLAASYIGQGLQEDAEWEIEQLLTQFPHYSITFLVNEAPFSNSVLLDRYISQLRQAGLPE